MAGNKITKRTVDAAEARPTRYTVFDGAIPGFGLRVYPSGEKSWIFEYRGGEGGRKEAKKRVTIGKASDFSVDQARKAADVLRSKVMTGGDPQATRAANRQAPTLAEVAAIFLDQHVHAKRKVGTASHYADIINRIVIPELGSTKAKDLKRSDFARLHLAWRHTPFQANRMLAVVGSMYSFANVHGLVPEGVNPVRGIEKYGEEGRERLLSGEELLRLGAAIRQLESVGVPWSIDPDKKTKHVPKSDQMTRIGTHAAAALRLLIFTGARLREILHLQWAHVDMERGLLLLPDSKTGRKTIVLNAPALEVLASVPRVGVYVIAGDTAGQVGEKPRADLKKPWTLVRKAAGLEDVRIHDLRHNFASFGAGGGMGLPIIGKLLGHTQAATTQRYAHLDNDPLRRASNAIGAAIAAAMSDTPRDSNVVPIKGSSQNP